MHKNFHTKHSVFTAPDAHMLVVVVVEVLLYVHINCRITL